MDFKLSFSMKVGFENIVFSQDTKTIFMIYLSCFEKQDIHTKLQRRNSSLKYESDWKSSYVEFNHKVIVTWFCESNVSHIYFLKGVLRINKTWS